jgi:hypothetical protein
MYDALSVARVDAERGRVRSDTPRQVASRSFARCVVTFRERRVRLIPKQHWTSAWRRTPTSRGEKPY